MAVEAKGQSRALLIGINDYALSGISDLRGAVNDVHMLKRVLHTRMGFPEENIVLLTDQQATRRNILDALSALVDKVQEDDRVYIHYSGHGSQVTDFSGDEEDGLDETILSHDARQPGIPDIIDDELDRLFSKLRSGNTLIVFDSCHSGTITRSVTTVQPRFVPKDERLDIYRNNLVAREVVPVNALGHVLMTSAPADMLALDAPVDGGYYGLFSYALAKALNKFGPPGTSEQIHLSVRQELRRIQDQLNFQPPEPQLEIDPRKVNLAVLPLAQAQLGKPDLAELPRVTLSKQELSSQNNRDMAISKAISKEVARRAWLSVESIDQTRVKLIDGVYLNAQPGSRWAIYGPEENRFVLGQALASGTVESLEQTNALMKLDEYGAPIPEGARAIAIAPADVSRDLSLLIEGVSNERLAKLSELLKQELSNLKLVSEGAFARMLVRLDNNVWQLSDAGGLQKLTSFTDTEDKLVVKTLIQALSRSSSSMSLLSLDNPSSDILMDIGIVTEESTFATQGIKVHDTTEPTYWIRKPGEPRSLRNSLMIEIKADRGVYLTIVSVDTEGATTVLFPNSVQNPGFLTDGYIPGEMVIRIPDTLKSGNLAGFYWDYSPPAGRDTLRAFAAEDLSTARMIRKLVSQSSQDSKALSQLSDELANLHTRGIRVATDDEVEDKNVTDSGGKSDTGDWTARSLVIYVRDK